MNQPSCKYKINHKILVAFLYTNKKHSEKEIRKTIASKIIKSLEINLIKVAKDLYTENNKMLLKKN